MNPMSCERCGQTHTRCAAHRKDGQPCTQWAMRGQKVCRKHGGKASQNMRAAARRRQEEEARRAAALFGAPLGVEPSQALLDLVHWTAGEVEFWRQRVREIAAANVGSLTWGQTREKTGGQDVGDTYEAKPAVEYVMLYAAQDRLAQYAQAALKAGVEERRVRIAESQGDLVVTVIRRILNAMDLTEAQQQLIPTVVPRELRALTGEAS